LLSDTLDIIYIRYRVHFKIILEYISNINNTEILDSRWFKQGRERANGNRRDN